MKYACEIMDTIAVETLRKEAEKFTKAMEVFEENLEKIDKYVEDKLIQGNGSATLLIDNWYDSAVKPNGFYYFAKKNYKYSPRHPYWINTKETEYFPLDWYIKYLEGYCYKVEVVYLPFRAMSSTRKSYETMEGIHLKISTDCTA